MSFNFGAKKRESILNTRRYAFLYMAILVSAGTVIIELLPNQLLNLFGATEEMRQIGIPALRIIATSFIFEGFCLINQTSFQTVGRNLFSLICSVTRQIVILLPLTYLLSLSGNINYVWLAFPVAYALSSVVCLVLWKDVQKRKIP